MIMWRYVDTQDEENPFKAIFFNSSDSTLNIILDFHSLEDDVFWIPLDTDSITRDSIMEYRKKPSVPFASTSFSINPGEYGIFNLPAERESRNTEVVRITLNGKYLGQLGLMKKQSLYSEMPKGVMQYRYVGFEAINGKPSMGAIGTNQLLNFDSQKDTLWIHPYCELKSEIQISSSKTYSIDVLDGSPFDIYRQNHSITVTSQKTESNGIAFQESRVGLVFSGQTSQTQLGYPAINVLTFSSESEKSVLLPVFRGEFEKQKTGAE